MKSIKTFPYAASGLLFFLPVFSLVACGPESNSYTPVQDTVTVTSAITLDAASQSIHILNLNEAARSDTIDDCEISFGQDADLDYSFPGTDELKLGALTMDFVRPLAVKAVSPSVDERLFAVWKIPEHRIGLVSYNIEIEIRADQIIYRNTCIR